MMITSPMAMVVMMTMNGALHGEIYDLTLFNQSFASTSLSNCIVNLFDNEHFKRLIHNTYFTFQPQNFFTLFMKFQVVYQFNSLISLCHFLHHMFSSTPNENLRLQNLVDIQCFYTKFVKRTFYIFLTIFFLLKDSFCILFKT